jgi:hypothetical protein
MCLDKCQHLISNPDRRVRLRVIETIGELSRNLATEHENDFLPLVHKLWSPLMQRFALDDPVVKARIVRLLFELSVLCGDFISSRFVKEFLRPRLCAFMFEQARASAGQDATYAYTSVFKLQAAVLMHIDKMCILFDVKELDLEFVVERIVLGYLDRKQPRRLQALAVEGLRNLALIDPDVVWVCLHYVLPQFEGEENRSKFIKNKKLGVVLSDETVQSLNGILKGI